MYDSRSHDLESSCTFYFRKTSPIIKYILLHYFCITLLYHHKSITFAFLFSNNKKQNPMTKIEIVREIASKTGLEKKDVMVIVESLMETIKTSMTNGEEVFLRGFGSFIIKHRADKTARNITKNTTVIIPAHDIPTFKPAKEFMDKVRG